MPGLMGSESGFTGSLLIRSGEGWRGRENCEGGRRKDDGVGGGEKGVREKGKDRARREVDKVRCVQCVRFAWKTDFFQALDDVPSSSHLRGYMEYIKQPHELGVCL